MTEKNLVIVATLGAIPLPMPHLFCRFPTSLVPFLIFEREATFPYLSEPQCTQLAVAQSTRCGSISRACSFAPFPPKSRACVQYQYLDRSMRHPGNVCAPDFAQYLCLGWPDRPTQHDH